MKVGGGAFPPGVMFVVSNIITPVGGLRGWVLVNVHSLNPVVMWKITEYVYIFLLLFRL